MKKILFIILVIHFPLFALNKHHIDNLYDIYSDHRYTFFCEQAFHSDGRLVLPQCSSCTATPLNIQWMAIVPVKRFATLRPCYHEKRCMTKKGTPYKGIRCCEKSDPFFIQFYNDLHNRVPENPTLIRTRGQSSFGDISNVTFSKKNCHFYQDSKRKVLSPSPSVRGFIARTTLYLSEKYRIPLTEEERLLFIKWHETYPITDWERERHERIVRAQGERNPYIF